MNQTDKNIALAKECGAIIKKYTYPDTTTAKFDACQLDEYTSRVCAESKGSPCRNSCIDFCLTESLQIRIEELDKLLAEKDALIAMQEEALEKAIHALHFAIAPPSVLKPMVDALAATAETVEAWKNRQGDKK